MTCRSTNLDSYTCFVIKDKGPYTKFQFATITGTLKSTSKKYLNIAKFAQVRRQCTVMYGLL